MKKITCLLLAAALSAALLTGCKFPAVEPAPTATRATAQTAYLFGTQDGDTFDATCVVLANAG